ncbi:amidohydrolase family protein [Sphingomonas sp.]|jgi:aminocarboxymuconate-semialdehyde decarboxylase|uniref:amidohydrolase family protein n=1 Tax=Sphingomonas sp. TaxID=28214 RepID=UPI002ED7EF44
MRIDVHTHFHSPKLFEKLDELGGFQELVGLQVLGIHRRKYWEKRFAIGLEGVLEERFAAMDEAGCDRQILDIGAYQPYFRNQASAVAAARFANDLYAELSAANSSRFSYFACLPLPHIDATLAEIDRVLGQSEQVGVVIGCSAHGLPLDDERFEPVWAELNRRKTVVFLHPGVQMASVPGAQEYHLGPDFCSPAEIAVAATRLIIRGVTSRYPDIRFLISTTGGGLPFFAHRFDHGYQQQNPQEYAELGGVASHYAKFWFDTSVIEEPLVLLAAKELFGADKMMLGSDSPRIDPILAVDYITDSVHLTETEKHNILEVNAAQLLGFAKVAAFA